MSLEIDDAGRGVRRIEAPVLVDRKGATWTPGLIDVTVRHRERTVLAESPPPGLPPELAQSIADAAARLAGARGAAGAFTVSFLAAPASGEQRFLGTSPGLPAGFAVVEACDEADLPALELHLSRGGILDGDLPESRGHALQVCLSARDAEDGFAPSPGVVEALRLPAGPGLRADAAVDEGGVPADEIARLTAHGRTRNEALSRLQGGLARLDLSLRNGATDKAFLTEILDRPELTAGDPDPAWIERLVAGGEHLSRRGAEVALLAAAIASYEEELAAARRRFFDSAARGRPAVPKEIGHAVELLYRGCSYFLRVARLDLRRFRIEMEGRRLEALVEPPGRTRRRIACGERSWQVSLASQDRRRVVEVDGIPHRVEVVAGQTGDSPACGNGGRVSFEPLRAHASAGAPAAEGPEEARYLLLGFDADPAAVQELLAEKGGASSAEAPRREEETLRTFADIGSLFRRQPLEGPDRHSSEEYLQTYLRDLDAGGEGLPASFLYKLRRTLVHYGVAGLEPSGDLAESLFRIAISRQRSPQQVPVVLTILERWLERGDRPASRELRELLDRLISETQGRDAAVHDLAREVRYRCFDRPLLLAARERVYAAAEIELAKLADLPGPEERAERIRALVECPQPLHWQLSRRFARASPWLREALLEVMVRRFYRIREVGTIETTTIDGQTFAFVGYDYRGSHVHLIATHASFARVAWTFGILRRLAGDAPAGSEIVADLYFWRSGPAAEEDAVAAEIGSLLTERSLAAYLQRAAVSLCGEEGTQHYTFRRSASGVFAEDRVYRGIHPLLALRLELWRLQNFELERLPAPEGVYFFRGVARQNPRDERLFAMAEVRDLTPVHDGSGRVLELPQLEYMLMEALAGIRRFQSRRAATERLHWNRVQLNVWPPVDLRPEELTGLLRRLAPLAEGLGLEKVAVRCRIPDRERGELREWVLEISNFEEAGMVLRFRKPKEAPLKPLREYAQKVVDLRRRGLLYPYEVVKRLTPSAREAQTDLPAGDFAEHDLDAEGRLVPVHRPYGENSAAIVVGVARNLTACYPEGMARVILLGDPSRNVEALGEPECRRILAALDLATTMRVPVEWFALAAGTTMAAGSGTESQPWHARVLRRIVELTQQGGEINVVVTGINAGAQPFWTAAATMLMHTRGILVMTGEGAMVLTGRRAEDEADGVSTEDSLGIGGYERIMGPNGQAQYFARDLGEACRILLRHYEHTYVAPGERFPRSAATGDPRERDVRAFPHGGSFSTVGEVFSAVSSPDPPRPFEIRRVMAAVADQDHGPLERWYGMRDAEIAVVWDAHLGGHSISLLGFESKPLPRLGRAPALGPEHWTGSTLFPLSAKKVARGINAASGNRPLVVLAHLSGFDGSPESMRRGQLEYAAEIAHALVNFQGPIVVCVVSPDHGAPLVFSEALHDNLQLAALEGSSGTEAASATIPPQRLRPYLIEAVERGMEKELARAQP